MKFLLTMFLLVSVITDPVTKIAKSNRLKKQAKEAFNNAEYEKAVNTYLVLFDSLQSEDEVARMNMANAAYLMSYGGDNIGLMKDISSGQRQVQDSAALSQISDQLRFFDIAESNYNDLTESNAPTIASSAYNQLGVISYKMSEQSPDERESFMQNSLSNFKNAIRKNPENESARYNYELLKKLEKQQEEEQKKNEENKDQDQKEDQEKKDQEKQDQENKDKQEQEKKEDQDKDSDKKDEESQDQENKEQQNQDEEQKPQEEDPMQKIKDKLKEMNISPEKAEMILEAMKNNEIQYVQQNKRKATKRKDSKKPDW